MRWIDRGPEPDGVKEYAQRFTQGWVRYFREGVGERPGDSHWREVRGVMGERSGGNCWYCERRCMREAEDTGKSPTVDHFRPLNRFPELGLQLPEMQRGLQRGRVAALGLRGPECGR